MLRTLFITWIISLANINDRAGHPIHRPLWFVIALADHCLTTATPMYCAAELDVYAAYESSYRVDAVGDHGRSCGLGQTPCASTPKNAQGQLALAWEIHVRSALACPAFPNALYGTGKCQPWGEGKRRDEMIAAAARVPWPTVGVPDADGIPEVEDGTWQYASMDLSSSTPRFR